MREPYVKLDDRPIHPDEWARYEEELALWESRTYESDMDRAMSKPNPPNYFRANND